MSTDQNLIQKGRVESIAFGGDAIVRHNGRVIFVPFAAPEDEIIFEIRESKKTFARANLIEVVHKSPHRVKPRCTKFALCGGCTLQHLEYGQQLAFKKQFVEDALVRIGKLSNIVVQPVLGAEQPWSYRRHVRLHFKKARGGVQIGYIRHDHQGLVDIRDCAIFDEENPQVIEELRSVVFALKSFKQDELSQVTLFKSFDKKYVALFHDDLPGSLDLADLLKNKAGLKGVMGRNQKRFQTAGDCHLEFQLSGLAFTYNPLAFVQSHPEQSARLYLHLIELIQKENPSRILDLYCGIGVTSLLLGRKDRAIWAIEKNPEAIRLAKKNGLKNQIDHINWLLADVDEVIERVLPSFAPDAIVVNPPRTGLSQKVLSALCRFKPKSIFYISCMPATLARDLSSLSKAGFEVLWCQPYDMFPQTTHVETLVHLNFQSARIQGHNDCTQGH